MLNYFNEPPFHGAVLSFSVSFLSNLFYDEKIKKAVVEACLCTSITFGLVSSLEFFSFPQSLSPGIGISVSLLGFDKVKKNINNYLNARIREKKHLRPPLNITKKNN